MYIHTGASFFSSTSPTTWSQGARLFYCCLTPRSFCFLFLFVWVDYVLWFVSIRCYDFAIIFVFYSEESFWSGWNWIGPRGALEARVPWLQGACPSRFLGWTSWLSHVLLSSEWMWGNEGTQARARRPGWTYLQPAQSLLLSLSLLLVVLLFVLSLLSSLWLLWLLLSLVVVAVVVVVVVYTILGLEPRTSSIWEPILSQLRYRGHSCRALISRALHSSALKSQVSLVPVIYLYIYIYIYI